MKIKKKKKIHIFNIELVSKVQVSNKTQKFSIWHIYVHKAWFEYYTVCIHSCTGFMVVKYSSLSWGTTRFSERSGKGAKCFKTAVYSKTFHHLNLQSKAYYCRDFPLKHKMRQHSAIHGMQSSRYWDDISHTRSKLSKQIFQILRILKKTKQTKTLQYH